MSKSKTAIIDNKLFDMSNIEVRRSLQSTIGTLDGPHRVTIKPGRPGVTDPQRAYWFGVIVAHFAMYMMDEDAELRPKEAAESAHIELKKQVLSEPICNQHGEVIAEKFGSLANGSETDKKRMSKAIDDAINWLGSKWDIAVPPPTREERYGRIEPVKVRKSA